MSRSTVVAEFRRTLSGKRKDASLPKPTWQDVVQVRTVSITAPAEYRVSLAKAPQPEVTVEVAAERAAAEAAAKRSAAARKAAATRAANKAKAAALVSA